MKKFRLIISGLLVLSLLAGCSSYQITSMDEVNLPRYEMVHRHKPWWALIWYSTIDKEQLRKEIAAEFNANMQKSTKRFDIHWAWAEGDRLVIVNPAAFHGSLQEDWVVTALQHEIDEFHNGSDDEFRKLYCKYFTELAIVPNVKPEEGWAMLQWKKKTVVLKTAL